MGSKVGRNEMALLLALTSLILALASIVAIKAVSALPLMRGSISSSTNTVSAEEVGFVYIAAVIPVATSTIAAAIALYAVASAGFAAMTEKPELRSWVLIFAGLAEGLAIYGLLISILVISRI
ncbi:MAG: hypothetical protein J7L75_02820 [Thermoproteales archaeon]|nr:hypothetical protein [Thermoproteales archaeon]